DRRASARRSDAAQSCGRRVVVRQGRHPPRPPTGRGAGPPLSGPGRVVGRPGRPVRTERRPGDGEAASRLRGGGCHGGDTRFGAGGGMERHRTGGGCTPSVPVLTEGATVHGRRGGS